MLTLLCFSGFQTLIGQVDVKSLPVYFYVRFTYTDYHTANWPIPFELEMLNVGGAMDLRSGTFTAPRDGTYTFSFTGSAFFKIPSSGVVPSRQSLYVSIRLNGNSIGSGHADETSITTDQFETFSVQSTVNLQKGDQVWCQIDGFSYADLSADSSFSGWLLEENMSQLVRAA